MPSQATIKELAEVAVANYMKELEQCPDKFVLISRIEAVRMIAELRQQKSPEFFSALTIRRNAKPGFPAERWMIASFNVEKYKLGKPAKYNPDDYNLFWVCDMELVGDPESPRGPYRSINAEGLLALKIRKVHYKVIREGLSLKADRV